MNRINPFNETPGEPLSFTPEVLAALRAFRPEKPWRGTRDERVIKFDRLRRDLCAIYELQWTFDYSRVPEPELEHGNGGLDREGQTIVLSGKAVGRHLSVLFGRHPLRRPRESIVPGHRTVSNHL